MYTAFDIFRHSCYNISKETREEDEAPGIRKEVVSMGKFVVRAVPSGIKFDLKATNGEVIATSEVYKSKVSCLNGVKSVAKNAPVANVEDQTVEGWQKAQCPKFEMYVDKAGEYRFRLKATNGQVIATSEGYVAKKSCENGIESVKKNAVDAPVVEE